MSQSGFCILFLVLISANRITVSAQTGTAPVGPELNAIQTAIPFLTITPDSRAGAMGDVGAASEPDVNSQYWNAAKYPFMENQFGVALAYTPWISELISNVYLTCLAGFYKIDDKHVLSAGFRLFSADQIIFTNNFGTPQGIYVPREFAIDAGYSRKLSENFSGGIVLRIIHSDLTTGQTVEGGDSKIVIGVGLEYWYNRIIAIRGGYFHEHETKGARRYYTVGVGLQYKYIFLDGSYLIPVKSKHPLTDTYRLTVSLAFGRAPEN